MSYCCQEALSATFIIFSGIYRLNYADQGLAFEDWQSCLVGWLHAAINVAKI
jgi:hypothetical protein